MAKNLSKKRTLDGDDAKRFESRLHLMCLLFEDVGEQMLEGCLKHRLPETLLDLTLAQLDNDFDRHDESDTGGNHAVKILGLILLWFDQYDRVLTLARRRAELKREMDDRYQWHYEEKGEWLAFAPAQNKKLTDAFKAGDKTVAFSVARNKYTVTLTDMTQRNVDSGFSRPVLVARRSQPTPQQSIDTPLSSNGETSKKDQPGPPEEVDTAMDTSERPAATDDDTTTAKLVDGLDMCQRSKLVSCCVQLLGSPLLHAATLHSVLRLCVRLTRDPDLATDFLHLGGLRNLMLAKTYRTEQSLTAIQTLTALLVRNVLEDRATLKHTFEKVVRAVAQSSALSRNVAHRWDARHARQNGEFNLTMRALAPVASRAPEIFKEVAKSTIRFSTDNGTPARREGASVIARQLKVAPPTPSYSSLAVAAAGADTAALKEVIGALLDSITAPPPLTNNETDSDKQTRRLVSKPIALSLLAEFVRSYSPVAILVAEHQDSYKEHTAIAYLLDHLLTVDDPKSIDESELSVGTRTLVSTLSAANHSPKAQEVLVTEVKNGLLRCMRMENSTRKYAQIASFASLLLLMRESCPTLSAPNQPAVDPLSPAAKPASINSNTMLRLFYKKRICHDLAHVSLNIDLSHPVALQALNSVLKTLEELSRLINTPHQQHTVVAGGQQQAASAAAAGATTGANGATARRTTEARRGTDNAQRTSNTVAERVPDNASAQATVQETETAVATAATVSTAAPTSVAASSVVVAPSTPAAVTRLFSSTDDAAATEQRARAALQQQELLSVQDATPRNRRQPTTSDDDESHSGDDEDEDDEERVADRMDHGERRQSVSSGGSRSEDDTTATARQLAADDAHDPDDSAGAGGGRPLRAMDDEDDDDESDGITEDDEDSIDEDFDDDDHDEDDDDHDDGGGVHRRHRRHRRRRDMEQDVNVVLSVGGAGGAGGGAAARAAAENAIVNNMIAEQEGGGSSGSVTMEEEDMLVDDMDDDAEGNGGVADDLGSNGPLAGGGEEQDIDSDEDDEELVRELDAASREIGGALMNLGDTFNDMLEHDVMEENTNALLEQMTGLFGQRHGAPGGPIHFMFRGPRDLLTDGWYAARPGGGGARVTAPIVHPLLAPPPPVEDPLARRATHNAADSARRPNNQDFLNSLVAGLPPRYQQWAPPFTGRHQGGGVGAAVAGLAAAGGVTPRGAAARHHPTARIILGNNDPLFNIEEMLRGGGAPGGGATASQILLDSVDTGGADNLFNIYGRPQTAAGGGSGGGGVTANNNVPSALSRWTEEWRLLDGAAAHFLVAAIRGDIEQHLEEILKRDKEEERKKQKESKKAASKDDSAPKTHKKQPSESSATTAMNEDTTTPPATEAEATSSATAGQEAPATSSGDAEMAASNDGASGGAEEATTTAKSTSDSTAADDEDMRLTAGSDTLVQSGAAPAAPPPPPPPTTTTTQPDATLMDVTESTGASSTPSSNTETAMSAAGLDASGGGSGTALSNANVTTSTTENVTNSDEPTTAQATSSAADVGEASASSSTTTAAVPNPPPTTQRVPEEFRAILGDIEIPSGVDAAFLAALPDDMRREVIEDHMRQQRLQRLREQQNDQAVRSATNGNGGAATAGAAATAAPGDVGDGGVTSSGGTSAVVGGETEQNATAAAGATGGAAGGVGSDDISQEFLDALPPELQEEILQQRLAQQTAAAQQPPQLSSDAAEGVDPAVFFESLTPSLRQQVLADADESVIAILPAHLQTEARRLRESVNARVATMLSMGAAHYGGSGLAHRYTGGDGRHRIVLGGAGGGAASGGQQTTAGATAGGQQRNVAGAGQQLVDREGATALLTLFFVEPSKINGQRLQRILKNLCSHAPTCDYVVQSMMSILERLSQQSEVGEDDGMDVNGSKAKTKTEGPHGGGWLDTITVDTGLGNRTAALELLQQGRHVRIHPSVAQSVCRQILDCLISVARVFSGQFLPSSLRVGAAEKTAAKSATSSTADDSSSASKLDYFQVVYKVNTSGPPRSVEGGSAAAATKAKLLRSQSTSVALNEETTFKTIEEAPLGRMIAMLTSRVMLGGNGALLERLLKLLVQIVSGLPSDSYERLTADGANPEPILQDQLKTVVQVVTKGVCTEEGVVDGRTLLLDTVKVLGRETRNAVYRQLLDVAVELGQTLYAQIERLRLDLRAIPLAVDANEAPGSSSNPAAAGGAVGEQRVEDGLLRNRFDGSVVVMPDRSSVTIGGGGARRRGGDVAGANAAAVVAASNAGAAAATTPELQLPIIMEITARNSCQERLLRALQTFMQMREMMKTRDEARRREQQSLKEIDAEVERRVAADERVEGETDEQRLDRIRRDVIRLKLANPAAAVAPAADAAEKKEGDDATTAVEAEEEEPKNEFEYAPLSALVTPLEPLWDSLSAALRRLNEGDVGAGGAGGVDGEGTAAGAPSTSGGATGRGHGGAAVTVLEKSAEAFFVVHAGDWHKRNHNDKAGTVHVGGASLETPTTPAPTGAQSPRSTSVDSQTPSSSMQRDYSLHHLPTDAQKLIRFAQQHRRVLNNVLRNSTQHLADGPFAVLIDFPKLLDFDIKRGYFRKELRRLDARTRRYEDIAIRVRRQHLFSDSFRELFRLRPHEWKSRFHIQFEGEEGQDAGGLLREWYSVITKEIFNPHYALFCTAPGDGVTYMINKSSYVNVEHLEYFKFIGRLIAKAVYDAKHLACYFTRAFYKHILNLPVRYQDIESEDPSYYQSLVYLLEHPIKECGMELTFTVEIEEFGVREVRELKPGGKDMAVTDENKEEYIRLVCQMKMAGSVRKQLNSFLEGFYEIIPTQLISVFNEQELELLISGLPNIDVDDLQANTEYRNYTKTSPQIQWLWRCVRSFEKEDQAKLLQFVTGTSKVPLQGFAALEGMNGVQKFSVHLDGRSTDRLPTAHTCFNQLDLPVYENYEKLQQMLMTAIHECSEGFGLA